MAPAMDRRRRPRQAQQHPRGVAVNAAAAARRAASAREPTGKATFALHNSQSGYKLRVFAPCRLSRDKRHKLAALPLWLHLLLLHAHAWVGAIPCGPSRRDMRASPTSVTEHASAELDNRRARR